MGELVLHLTRQIRHLAGRTEHGKAVDRGPRGERVLHEVLEVAHAIRALGMDAETLGEFPQRLYVRLEMLLITAAAAHHGGKVQATSGEHATKHLGLFHREVEVDPRTRHHAVRNEGAALAIGEDHVETRDELVDRAGGYGVEKLLLVRVVAVGRRGGHTDAAGDLANGDRFGPFFAADLFGDAQQLALEVSVVIRLRTHRNRL